MKRLRIVCCLTAMLMAGANAQQERAGTNLFPFLELGYDGRTMAMAGIGAGLANEINGVLCNPAALGYVRNMQAMVTFEPLIMDVKAGSMGFARPFTRSNGVAAASLTYLSYGVIDGVDKINGEIVNTGLTYRPYALAGGLTWSQVVLPDMSVGATLKGIYSNLGGEEGYAAHGIALDLGWQYRMLDSRLVYGLVMRNLGYLLSGYTSATDNQNIPLSVRAGVSYIPQVLPNVLFALDLDKAMDDYLNYRLAAEIAAYKRVLFLRGGVNFSHKDVREKLRDWLNLSEDTSRETYQKSNWYIGGLGVGFVAPVNAMKVSVDAAVNFRVDWLPPSVTLGLRTDF